ncbi:hypothetical protein [Nocardia sp. NPDC052566]|uniref:hypothetical protein n=1 Tax=Nocardia sp. NPDC052566 TaxID=3364330 RepID=UPI0037CB9B2B
MGDTKNSSNATTPTKTERSDIVLLGIADQRLARIANELRDSGVGEVAVGPGAVGAATDLVLFTVSVADGTQPLFLEHLAALDGQVVARAAVLLFNPPGNPVGDHEIIELVRVETLETLRRYEISDLRPGDVVSYPAADFVARVRALLDGSRHDHHVRKPVRLTTTEPPAKSAVPSFAGVPLNYAVTMLEELGMKAVVLADPDFGLVNTCYPPVAEQIPAAGVVVPKGTSVGLLVAAPDTSEPPECALPKLTRAQVDARVAELKAQPGVR